MLYMKIFIDYNPEVSKYVLPKEKAEEQRIIEDEAISKTMRLALIQSRVGQGDYRTRLLQESSVCPFTFVNDERLLVASHLKPWAQSTDEEKLDPKNGIICTPTYDKLIDRGFITISDDKKLIVSPWLSQMNQKRLGIYTGKIIRTLILDSDRKKYMAFHREKIFKS